MSVAQNKTEVKALTTTNDYLLQASLDQLHAESVEWESEMEMLKIDADFVDKMLAKAALFVLSDDTYYEIHNKEKQLQQFKTDTALVWNKVQQHEQMLSGIIDKVAPHDEQAYRQTHAELNGELANFLNRYKQLKETIYSLLRPVLLEKHQWV